MRRTLAVLLLLAALAGCTRRADRAGTPETRTVSVGDRTALVTHPPGVGDGAPLVVMLHGGFGSGQQAEQSYGWDEKAASAGFVVAYPDGLDRAWNAGACCGAPMKRGVDDVAFLHALVQQLAADDKIDLRRVYAVGMSNGAMMTYAWACARPDDLAGIGPVAGALEADCDQPPPMTVVAIHGAADQHVPMAGGVGPAGVTDTPYTPFAEAVTRYRTADACPTASTISTEGPLTTTEWTCADGRTVTTAVIDGAGHQWPGGRARTPAEKLIGMDDPSTALDATDFLWQHLTA